MDKTGAMNRPRLGLLIDVDGPISHLDHKRIEEPSIVDSLRALVGDGIPIVLNTGRAGAFVKRQVVDVVQRNIYVVCEKGAVWFRAGEELNVDRSLATPESLNDTARRLAGKYSSAMFYDTEKVAMISIERAREISMDVYEKIQAQALEELTPLVPDEFVVAKEAIAIDVQSPALGKDLGAQRALAMLREDGIEPREWRTIGDSDGDYAMADWLHSQGMPVKHVDVRSGGTQQRRDYPVLRPSRTELDVACSAYLRWCVSGDGKESEFDARSRLERRL